MHDIIIWVEHGPHDSAPGAVVMQGNLHLPNGKVATCGYVRYPSGPVTKSDGNIIDGDSTNDMTKRVAEDAIRKLASA